MKIPLQLTFRNMDHSDAVEADVQGKVDKLEQMFPNIMACRVVVEAHHHHKHQGNLFHTRIDLTIPGHELVISREPGGNHAHEEMHVSIRDAFEAARRQLEKHTDKLRKKVKVHETPPHGRISVLFPMEDYGRIQANDGRDIYFHRNSVINQSFDQLQEGDEVRFDEVKGDNGPQASTVRVIGKHHVLDDRP